MARRVARLAILLLAVVAVPRAWQAPLRQLLLARRLEPRRSALEELGKSYDGKSEEIFEELRRCAEQVEASVALRLRLRPFLGYRSAAASVYRTVQEHILPQQADSPVVLQKDEKRLRYVLQSDAMDADGRLKKQEDVALEDRQSRARALFVALRQLVNSDPWSLERSAKSGKEDWQARTPKLETPQYKVLSRDALTRFEAPQLEIGT